MNKVGILLECYGTYYFFCSRCSERLNHQSYRIIDVFREQFPPGMGQKCHTELCTGLLVEGPDLFKHDDELTRFFSEDLLLRETFINGSRRP